MDELAYQKRNYYLRIAIIILLICLGASVWYVGLGPSAEKVKLCYSITGIPLNQQSDYMKEHAKENQVCVTCYELMKQEADRIFELQNHSSKYTDSISLMDNLRKLNLSQ